MSGAPAPSHAELLAGFVAGTLPAFHHRDHVRVAWLYLRRHGLLGALARFPPDLRRFAAAKGRPEIYHETVTCAFLVLIHERIEPGSDDFDDFVRSHPELLRWRPSVVDGYYSPALLASEPARRCFVLPDRAPGDATAPAARIGTSVGA